ncbi:hypothetical protein ACQQ2N_09545 [Dokdonella sp. MW10]|uniref:hypothetical protein n=1 Tax=Dokdonella sp. MW10 TaxID=2992926 RepID=UPI003F814877
MQTRHPIRGALLAGTLLFAGAALAQDATITFDNGWEGWNPPFASSGTTTIDTIGGNPGANAHTDANVYDLAYYIDDIFGGTSPFLGSFATAESVTFSVDVKADDVSVGGAPVTRPLIVSFRAFDRNASVWYVLGELSSGQGWTTYSVTFDPRSTTMPAGWGGTGADDPGTGGPILPSGTTFADVLASVNETSIFTTIPYQPWVDTDFDVRVDNLRITRGSAPVKVPRYEIVDIGTLGGELANAHAINDSGTVVGVAMNEDWVEQPFIWRNGIMASIGSLMPSGTDHGIARGLSNAGHVAGYAMAPASDFPGASVAHAFFWTEATGMIDITPTMTGSSMAWDVNSAGQVVGEAAGAFLWTQADGITIIRRPNGTHAGAAEAISENGLVTGHGGSVNGGWVYDSSDASFRELMPLGTPATVQTRDINSAGTVVGWSRGTGIGARSVMWRGDGTIVDLGDFDPDYSTGVANAINEAGWIVGRDDFNGWSENPNRGWVWIDGQKYELKSLIEDTVAAARWTALAHPLDINNRGEIVGIGIYDDIPGRAFLMRPIVEGGNDAIFANGFD